MFYECPKCKRRWEYPLADCPYCFVSLEKMESKAVKVNSAVKVAIPTLFHPNVPYYILLLEDVAGNIWGHKSEKEYKAGDEFIIEANASDQAVAIWRLKFDVRQGIEKVLELIGGIKIDSGTKVAILPTIASPSHAYFKDNTTPQTLESVLQLLLDRGAKIENITVASQSFDEMPIAAAAQKSGLVEACMKFKIMPIDLVTTEFEKSGQFEISKPILNADIIINLAVGKIGQASATANLFKVLKKENYLGQKYLSSDTQIAQALEPILKQAITIVEAEYVQRPSKLTAFMGLIMAAKSARRIDRIFNEAAKASKLPEVIKDISVDDIPVAGRTIKEVQYYAEIF